eukprot:TRINITY_DN15549_c0_g1_i7.p1 TRINITY_DN15549_c0_g1~~TRINITY_DN15549_c0_g1_i7.p1  ORF type:complete len:293 (-),score=101.08 TRINITY_DN15549_c0_g1_i7:248-1003(-)
MLRSLVGSEMCIRDRVSTQSTGDGDGGAMAEPAGPKAVTGVQRRQWDKAHFAALAAERVVVDEETAEREERNEKMRKTVPVQRAPLQRDEYRDKVGNMLDATVNKRKMMTVKDAAQPGGGGAFVCELTGKRFHDSITYLDHINGKKYQREKGQNMRAERASLGMVRDRLNFHAGIKNNPAPKREFKSLDERMEESREQEENHKKQKKEYRERKREEEQKHLEESMNPGLDDEAKAMAEMMGMPMSFGTSKK